jgi:hypothetical protein
MFPVLALTKVHSMQRASGGAIANGAWVTHPDGELNPYASLLSKE